jgi:hypothetical protein
MDKKRIELIVTVFLILIFIFVLANSLAAIRRRGRPKGAFKSGIAVRSATAAARLPSAGVSADDEQLVWRRDPFSGKVYSGAGTEVVLDLKGILWDGKNPQALIGEEPVKEGDTIGKYRVIKIEKGGIVVNDGTKDIQVRME